LAADTTLSGPGGTGGSMEGGCRNVMLVVGRATNKRENLRQPFVIFPATVKLVVSTFG